MKRYIYFIKIMYYMLKNMKELKIDNNNMENEINEFVGNQGLIILTINTIGHERFSKLYKEYKAKSDKKSFKYEMLEVLCNREMLI